MENFTFLKNDYPDLYLLCSDVAKYINTDNSISMLKARQAIEFIVKYLGAETDDLFVNINNLEDKNIANSRIIDLFHLIRKKANKSVHNEINSDTEGVLDALIEICVWLAVGQDKKNISIIKFTDKEKFILKKYGDYKVSSSEENFEDVDTINPLEVVGKFSVEDVETVDVLEQDVFETYEEYCKRVESLPAIKIGYAFLDKAQVDEYSGVAFPLFHINKNPKIQLNPIAALFVLLQNRIDNIDGHIKAKLTVHNQKVYYDYGSLTLEDDSGHIVQLSAISWEKFGYESEADFGSRIESLPSLPVAAARPLRKEYILEKRILPFAIRPMAYAANLFNMHKIDCSLNRDFAKKVCSIRTNFVVYSRFAKNLKPKNIIFYNKTDKETITFYALETEEKRALAAAASIARIQAKMTENQDRSADQILIEKYGTEIVKFVEDYDKQLHSRFYDIKLNLLTEDKKRLSNIKFDSWNEIKDVDNICLIETHGPFSYQAQPLYLKDDDQNKYFLVAPDKLVRFTKKNVVEDAYLAFFRFTNNSISERGFWGRLVKPAIFQKVNDFYKLISKGEIELL